ncbi:unnamed protein product [Toxocara canis]|uniref:Tudor domain-containing protein n=1 Tax=Toxocara canis TaxID=6265 RepID=A0A183VCC3_TOXCA|nr:unnamed protein product [Toxocara canis]
MNEQKKSDAAFEEEEACSKQTEDAELADQDVFAVDDDIREDDEGSRFNDSSGVDTTMLDMYSRAVSSVYWSVGNRCLAPFYEDNMWYPAMIQKLHWKSGECEVLYEGYGNVATVSITDLAAINEDTRAEGNTCATQLSSSNSADTDCPNGEDNRRTERSRKCEEFLQQGLHALPSMAPPPPPSFLNRAAAMDGEDVEANMLISWYMCGYHTGYRQFDKNIEFSTVSTNFFAGCERYVKKGIALMAITNNAQGYWLTEEVIKMKN